MRGRVRVRTVLVIPVLIALAPIFGAVIYLSMSEQTGALEGAGASLRNQVQLMANGQQALLDGARDMLTPLGRASIRRADKPQACNTYLREANGLFPRYSHLGFADTDGNVVCRSSTNLSPLNVRDRRYFQNAVRTGRFTVGEYLISRILGTPAIALSLPVHLPSGQLLGVQYAVLELTALEMQLRNLAVPQGTTALVTDADGTVLAWAGPHLQRVGEPAADGFLLEAIRGRRTAAGKAQDARGREWLYAVQPVTSEGAGGLVVASLVSTADVLAPATRRLQVQLAVLLAIALAASFSALWIGDRLLARPIDDLVEKIHALEHWEHPVAADAAAGVEVRELRRISSGIDNLALALALRWAELDAALASLQEQQAWLEESERRYRSQFEASPQPMWVFDAATLAFLAVNDAAVAHYGYAREEFMEMSLASIVAPEERHLLPERIATMRVQSHEGIRARHRRRSGHLIDVEIATHPIDWNGRAACAAIIYDVTSRILAEQSWQRLHETLERKVAERTRELQLANEELDAFSHSVSHDLRGPLHIVDGFCAALLARHRDALPAQAAHYIDRIRAGTVQMNALIVDLLAFAKTGRAPLVPEQVDLAPLAANVIAQLRQRFPERQVSVEIEEPMPAFGDPCLLAIVLDNLIGNAWKFTSRAPQAVIRIGRAANAAATGTYVVSDNGAGFDMAHAAKLFKTFQRLHSAGEFEGTGIGLSIVHRIIQRHGGRIWAESEPDEGARFYFFLPGKPLPPGTGSPRRQETVTDAGKRAGSE